MSIVPFLIHGRFFEEEEKRPYEKVYEATTGGEGESRMKVKCAIPSRIKECGWCEHYIFPYITTTSEGETVDSPPSCRAGRDLATQKAPCPSYEKRMPCIFRRSE